MPPITGSRPQRMSSRDPKRANANWGLVGSAGTRSTSVTSDGGRPISLKPAPRPGREVLAGADAGDAEDDEERNFSDGDMDAYVLEDSPGPTPELGAESQ